MALKNIINKIKEEVKVIKGDATKDKVYSNANTFTDEVTAKREFERAKAKLFDVNNWTKLSGINSTFELYDRRGLKSNANKVEIGYYIKIILPASTMDNWVQITDMQDSDTLAEFIVHPSEKPQELAENQEEVKHFFIKEASSTFRVTLEGTTLTGYEIGKDEGINNQDEEAGNSALLNTLVAEGGWALFQEMPWDKLTKYLVHLEEI